MRFPMIFIYYSKLHDFIPFLCALAQPVKSLGRQADKWPHIIRNQTGLIKCTITKFRGRWDRACQFDSDYVGHRSRHRQCRLSPPAFFHVLRCLRLGGLSVVKNSFFNGHHVGALTQPIDLNSRSFIKWIVEGLVRWENFRLGWFRDVSEI